MYETEDETPEETESNESEVKESDLSIEEQVKQAYAELSGETDTDTTDADNSLESGQTEETEEHSDNEEGSANGETKEELKTEKRGPGRPRKSQSDQTPIEPPTDWDAESKEAFKRMDPAAQRENKRIAEEFSRWRRGAITQITNLKTEYETKARELEPALQVVNRFLPRWGAVGKTPEAALSELCAFNELAVKDIDAALEQLARAGGREIEIKNRTEKKAEDRAPLQSQPINVTHEVRRVLNEDRVHAQVTALANHIDEAHVALMNKTDASGRYLYPDLHNDNFVNQNLVPLVQTILGSNPNLTAEEAIQRAYSGAGGRVTPNQTSATTRPNGVVRNGNEAARRAAISSPGSFGASSNSIAEAKPGESVEETVARTWGQIYGR